MPEASEDTWKQLILHRFVNGLPANISKQLRATRKVNDMNAVMERMKLLITIEVSQKTAAIQTAEVQELKKHI